MHTNVPPFNLTVDLSLNLLLYLSKRHVYIFNLYSRVDVSAHGHNEPHTHISHTHKHVRVYIFIQKCMYIRHFLVSGLGPLFVDKVPIFYHTMKADCIKTYQDPKGQTNKH